MSRHTVPLPDGGELTVGWDRPLDTFFGVVVDSEFDDVPRLWVGGSVGELPTMSALWEALGSYADFVRHLAEHLEDDRLNHR